MKNNAENKQLNIGAVMGSRDYLAECFYEDG